MFSEDFLFFCERRVRDWQTRERLEIRVKSENLEIEKILYLLIYLVPREVSILLNFVSIGLNFYLVKILYRFIS